jgi:predicted RNA-binding protein YlxR (DUF448 family)
MAHIRNSETPQRSCLGCRAIKDQAFLIRFVLSNENEVLPDLDNKLPGRGAYTCTNKDCLTKAVTLRQFKRSFKQDVSVMPPEELLNHIKHLLFTRIIGLIGLANRAAMVIAGGSLVSDALKSRVKPGLVIVATDVSEVIGGKIIFLAEVHKLPHRTVLTKDDFGAILGKAPRSALAIKPGGFVVQLTKAIDRYINFLGEV